MEDTLHLHQSLLQGILDHCQAAICMKDTAGRYLLVNRSLAAMVNLAPEQLAGTLSYDLFSQDTADALRTADQQVITTGQPFSSEQSLVYGGVLHIYQETRFPICDAAGDIIAVGCISTNITERKRAEEALRESEERYQRAIRAGEVGVWDWNLETNEIYLAPILKALLGYEDHEIPNHLDEWVKHVHPHDKEQVMAAANACLEGLTPHYELEHRMFHKNGSVRWISVRGKVIRDEHGKPLRMSGTDTDITERKRLEAELGAALHQSQSLLQTVIENSSAAISVKDIAGRYILANQRAISDIGSSLEQIIGKTDDDLFPPEFASVFRQTEQEVIESGRPVEREEFIPRPDGLHTYLSVKFPLYNDQGQLYAIGGISTDITNRKRAEKALRGSQSLLRQLARQTTLIQEEERSRLSRELHDEAGQALTALLISLQLIQSSVPPAQEDLRQRLTEASNLTSTTMERLRQLAHALRPPALDTLGLNEALTDMGETFARRTGLVVHVNTTPLPELPDEALTCLYRFVQESLTNVARHAQARHVWVTLNSDAETVSITVEDDGKGIDYHSPEFQQTSGIGLLGIRERLRFVRGNLEIDSAPRQGTRVVATIPWSDEP